MMTDYFMTPMNNAELAEWEKRREDGLLNYLLVRGILLDGIIFYAILTISALAFWHHHLDASLLAEGLGGFLAGPSYRLYFWLSTEKRYEMTMREKTNSAAAPIAT